VHAAEALALEEMNDSDGLLMPGELVQDPSSEPPPVSFTEFVVVGVRTAILRGLEMPAPQDQPLEILERHTEPQASADGCGSTGADGVAGVGADGVGGPATPSGVIENIAEFCFPKGSRLEVVPAAQAELCAGPHRDQTHILQFTDANGATTYGVCITIYEPCYHASPSLIRNVKLLEQQNLAACRIQRFIRRRSRSASLDTKAVAVDHVLSDEVGFVRKGLFNKVRNKMWRVHLRSSGWAAWGEDSPVVSLGWRVRCMAIRPLTCVVYGMTVFTEA
jgi:hypothetical protein